MSRLRRRCGGDIRARRGDECACKQKGAKKTHVLYHAFSARGRRGPAQAGTAPNGMPRILAFVMDSAGVGALPDAIAYHDAPNANTIGNVAERLGGLRMPNFERLGFGHITTVRGLARRSSPRSPRSAACANARRARTRSPAIGRWPGVMTEVPFPTYPDGFPPDVIDAFTAIAGQAAARQPSPPRGPRSSPSWARSTSARAGRSSTPRPTRSSRLPRTKRPSRWRRSTTGASARGRCSSPRTK